MSQPSLVIVACSKKKASQPLPASEMYQGPFTQLCLRAARTQVGDNNIRKSAAHGLLRLDDVVEPYDVRLTEASALLAKARDQATRHDLLGEQVMAITPKAHTAVVVAVWQDVTTPLAGAAGIGVQRHRLSAMLRRCDQVR